VSRRSTKVLTDKYHLFIESNDRKLCLDLGDVDFSKTNLPTNDFYHDSLEMPEMDWRVLAININLALDDLEKSRERKKLERSGSHIE